MKLLRMEDIVLGRKYRMKTKEECKSIPDSEYHNAGICNDMPYGGLVRITDRNSVHVFINDSHYYSYSPEWFVGNKKTNIYLE